MSWSGPMRRSTTSSPRCAQMVSGAPLCATPRGSKRDSASFLDAGGFKAFTDTFEDLGDLPQLPGIGVQRLMADGYGFGAEGDWKTAALLRAAKVMGEGLRGRSWLPQRLDSNRGVTSPSPSNHRHRHNARFARTYENAPGKSQVPAVARIPGACDLAAPDSAVDGPRVVRPIRAGVSHFFAPCNHVCAKRREGQACGEDRAESDIDLLVDLPAGSTLLSLAGLTEELTSLMGVKVDVATADILRDEIRADVIASATDL